MSGARLTVSRQKGKPEEGYVHVLFAGKAASGRSEELSATVTAEAYRLAMEILLKSMKKSQKEVSNER